MGKINVARVILGGLLAGLIMNASEYVLNIYVIAEESAAMMQRFGLAPIGTHQIIIFLIMTFVLGIVAIFIYAGMRPRFGAGVKTAVITGFIVWLVAIFASIADFVLGILPANLLVFTGIWSLIEIVVATIVGAWLYTESA
jgi:hypothetical protein